MDPAPTAESRVTMRNIVWEIIVPLGLEWDFMKAFGEAFRLTDSSSGRSFLRPISSYFEHPNGWYITVTVHDTEEIRLVKFCRKYFGSHNVSFKEPGTIIHPSATPFLKFIRHIVRLQLNDGTTIVGKVTAIGPTHVTLHTANHEGMLDVDYDDIAHAAAVLRHNGSETTGETPPPKKKGHVH